MKVYEEISLKDFDFWDYAVVVADNMSDEDFDMIEQWMEEDGRDWDKTAINDLFAFNYEFVETLVGHNLVSYDEMMNILREEYDIDDPTNGLDWKEYFTKTLRVCE